ncbi:MAG TPA: OmpH family outer membrane protein [bacterium]|nr:OmpH family outer membrane protein [bacterium]
MKSLFLNLSFLAVFILTAVILSGPGAAWASGSNIAVVNMQKIISTSHQGKKAGVELKALIGQYRAKLLTMKKEIASIQANLKNNGSIMSASEKAKKTKEFETDISKFSSEEKHIQGIVSQKRFELLKGIVKKADSIIAVIAKENGYTLVINRVSVVYMVNSINITDEVLRRMNLK